MLKRKSAKKFQQLFLVIVPLLLVVVVGWVQAAEIQNPLRTEKFEEVITRFANFGAAIAGALMTLLVLYAGYLYLFSGGSEDMVKRARGALTWAVVGFIIILIAQGAAVLIKNILGTR